MMGIYKRIFSIRLLASAISVTGWCIMYLFFVFRYRFAFNYEIDINSHYYLVFTLPFLFVLLLLHVCTGHSVPSRKKIVWLIVTAIVTALLIGSKYYSFGNEYFVVLATIFFVSTGLGFGESQYAIKIIFGFVLAVYLFEIYTGLLQYLEAVLYNGNSVLAINGTLENSGVFACYLVVHLPLISLMAHRPSCMIPRKYSRLLYYARIILLSGIGILSCFLVFKTQSRTAYIALPVSVVGWLWFHYGRVLNAKIKPLPKMVILTMAVVLSALVAAGGYYLFALKKMSAMGRLMKTEITLQHFTDQFWTGTGIGRFSWYYPQWQSQYFKATPRPPLDYFLSAGESYIIFNEWLQWFKTVGFIGSVFTLVLLVYFFKAKSEIHRQLFNMLKLTVVSILICGFTSYPLHVNVLLLLLGACFIIVFMLQKPPLFFNNIAMQRSILSKLQPLYLVQNIFTIVCMTLLATAGYKGFFTYQAARQWQQMREGFLEPPKAEVKYAVLYNQLKTDGKFLTDYGALLADDSAHTGKAIAILEQAGQFIKSRATTEATARVYQQSGNYAKAIEQQEWLCYFLPNRFAPKQELMKLYQTTKDTVHLKRLAHIISTMPVKIPSPEIDQIKKEAAAVLEVLK